MEGNKWTYIKQMKVIYPGSFDPLTLGHIDIIKRLSKMFDEVVVAVLINEHKKSVFSLEEREAIIKEQMLKDEIDNVSISSFDGLLVNFAKENDIKIVARGLREVTDYEYEKNIAMFNSKLMDGLETIFLLGDPNYSLISSSGVREGAAFKGDVSSFVSKEVEERIKEKFQYWGDVMADNKLISLINEMEDVMDESSSVPFSRKVSVDPDEIYELLNEMKDALPEEIKQAQWVTDEKDRIIAEAKSEADSRLNEAENEINNIKEQARNKFRQLVSENEITREARNEAERIIEEANIEADKIRQQSYAYVDRLFQGSVENFSQLANQLEKNRRTILENK